MKVLGNRKWVAELMAVALAVVCFEPALRAQDQPPGQPARAVRLSYVDGQVTLSQGGQVLAQQAMANAPLLEGMQLTTGDSGKAEIQFEDGSVARVSPDSSLTLQTLQGAGTTSNAVLVLNSGLAYFELQGGGQAGQMSVQFGDTQVTTSGFTVFRAGIDNPPGQVAVFSGNAHLEYAGGNVAADLHGGESIALNAANPSNYQLAESIEPDSWDEWNSDRDQALTAEAAAQTGASANLSEPQNPAWNDLDADGNWYDVPGQGYVWSPYEAASAAFDPYGYGNWMWTPGYGYLWISGYPWGYMPFQCGAWNYFDGFGWGWAPGSGGCAPWWGSGFYGGPNIGHGPAGYRPIPRPILPRRPINGRPIPLLAVNRSPVFGGSTLPARNRNVPVTIGGRTVVPLRPVPSRPVFERPPSVAGGHEPQTGGGYGVRPGNEAPQPGRPGSRPGYNLTRPVPQEPTEGNRPEQPRTEPGQMNRPGYNQTRPVPQEPTEGNRPEQPRTEPGQMNRPEPPRPVFQPRPEPSRESEPQRPSSSGSGSENHSNGGGGSPHPSGPPSGAGGGAPRSSGPPSGGGGGGGGSHGGGSGGGGGGGGGSHGGGGSSGGGGKH